MVDPITGQTEGAIVLIICEYDATVLYDRS